MYHDFYNLTTDPFRLSPDHRFCFGHSSFKRARTYMEYALHRGEGFVMVTGGPGTGKSTLIEDLFAGLRGEPVVKAKLVSTQLYAEDLLRMVGYSFGVKAEGLDKATLLKKLTDLFIQHRRNDRRVLLVVDEAQDLPSIALEELRLLTNLQENSVPLLQIFLIGQQELREKIHGRDMEQVHQRIVAACHLEPLKLEETRAYVEHRLHCAGWTGDPCISDAAVYVIQHFSDGIPRRINLICSRLFLHGSVEEIHKLSARDVRLVLQELSRERLISRGGLTSEVIDLLADVAPAINDDCVPQLSRVPAPEDSARLITTTPAQPAQVTVVEPVPDNNQIPTQVIPPEIRDEHAPVAGVVPPTEVASTDENTAPPTAERQVVGEQSEKSWVGKSLVILISMALIGFLIYGLDPDTFRIPLTPKPSAGQTSSDRIEEHSAPPPTDAMTANIPRRNGDAATGQEGDDILPPQDQSQAVITTSHGAETRVPDSPREMGDDLRAQRVEHVVKEFDAVVAEPDDGSEKGLQDPGKQTENDEPVVEAGPEHVANQRETDDGGSIASEVSDREDEPDLVTAASAMVTPPNQKNLNDIEQALTALKLPVSRIDDGTIEVNLRSVVPFRTGSAEISANSRKILDQLASVLRRYEDIALRVVGHTDKSGAEEYNLYLSRQRAATVAEHLRQVGPARMSLSMEGRGSSDPVVPDDSDDRHLNRRTVLYIEVLSEG